MIAKVFLAELLLIWLCIPMSPSVFPCVLAVNVGKVALLSSDNLKLGTCGGNDSLSTCGLFLFRPC